MPLRAAKRLFLAGRSLRAQANRRMLLVALIASALLFTVGALSYRLLNQRELALRHD